MTAPVRDQEWRNQAACASSAPWFDDAIDGETAEARAARLAAAVQVCERCPVTEACAAERLPWEVGCWGGVVYGGAKNPYVVAKPSNVRANGPLNWQNRGEAAGCVNTPRPLGTTSIRSRRKEGHL